MNLVDAIDACSQLRDLTTVEMESVMGLIMKGEATPAQIGAFLVVLKMKGETVEELVAAARVMRGFATSVKVSNDKVIDSVGTGGDRAGIFNVSTAAALVVSAHGGVVAKHGNRAATGKSGSADVLEAAGVNIDLKAEQAAHTIEQIGIGFLFAPAHHSATRHAMLPRREIGVRTIFNLLGPLTNPADAKYQLVGVFDKKWLGKICEVFRQLGSIHTLVVHSRDGLDEISIAAETDIVELRNNVITSYTVRPQDFDIEKGSLEELQVDTPQESLDIILEALSGVRGPAYNMVAINSGAALYAGDRTRSLRDGVDEARKVLDSGAALDKLYELVALTNKLGDSSF
ncbi:MAG: anthranilate phosphoribosyltransferase [Acidiferrobacteraceae bacterium]|nr:anthranilate phosphoribosyltransferase [Acidiferrobacteraceae bacterium]